MIDADSSASDLSESSRHFSQTQWLAMLAVVAVGSLWWHSARR